MIVTDQDPFTRILFRPEDGRHRLHMGPWAGEFGYEVGSWLPFVRHIRDSRPGCCLIVSGDIGHHVLYEGIVDEYWVLPKVDGARLCEWRENSRDLGFARAPGPILRKLLRSLKCHEQVWPRFLTEDKKTHRPICATTVGREHADRWLIENGVRDPFAMIFPRKRMGWRFKERNWPRWQKLARSLRCQVVCSGRREDTEILDGFPSTIDLDPHDELSVTLALLERCAAIVTSNSGAAILSGCMRMHCKMFLIGPEGCANVLGVPPRSYVNPSRGGGEIAKMIDKYVGL